MKSCSSCKKVLHLDLFENDSRYSDGKRSQCSQCRYSSQRDRRLDSHLQRKYGISLSEFKQISTKQGDVCAICGLPETAIPGPKGKRYKHTENTRLVVDHDHETGKVRGLLCRSCNIGLGIFKDSTENLRVAIEYLEKASD